MSEEIKTGHNNSDPLLNEGTDSYAVKVIVYMCDGRELRYKGNEAKEVLIDAIKGAGCNSYAELEEASKHVFVFANFENWTEVQCEELNNLSLSDALVH